MFEVERKSLNFRKGDWDYLRDMYQSRGLPPTIVIRHLIAEYVEAMKLDPALIEKVAQDMRDL